MPTLSPVKTETTVKQSFIAALRSGKFQQCKEVMKSPFGAYCAMGVFHAINGDTDIDYIALSSQFSPSVFNTIAGLNDSGKTFIEIADILEAGLSEDLQYLSYAN